MLYVSYTSILKVFNCLCSEFCYFKRDGGICGPDGAIIESKNLSLELLL